MPVEHTPESNFRGARTLLLEGQLNNAKVSVSIVCSLNLIGDLVADDPDFQIVPPSAKGTLTERAIHNQPPGVWADLQEYFGGRSAAETTHAKRHAARNDLSHVTDGLSAKLVIKGGGVSDAQRNIGEAYFERVFGKSLDSVSM